VRRSPSDRRRRGIRSTGPCHRSANPTANLLHSLLVSRGQRVFVQSGAAEQALVGAEVWAATFARVAELALGDAMPLRQNAYKIALARPPSGARCNRSSRSATRSGSALLATNQLWHLCRRGRTHSSRSYWSCHDAVPVWEAVATPSVAEGLDVDHSAGTQFHAQEGEQRPKEEIRRRQEVTRPHLVGMIAQRGNLSPTGGSLWPRPRAYFWIARLLAQPLATRSVR